MEHPVQDVVGLEVGLAAVEVHEPSRNEAPLFVEHEPDAPAPARDGLAAAAALRLRARRALGAVDPREAPVRKARARRALKQARQKRRLSQVDLAQRMGSSQSRVAKIEAGDPSVTIDLMVRAILATGATRRELQRAFTVGEKIAA